MSEIVASTQRNDQIEMNRRQMTSNGWREAIPGVYGVYVPSTPTVPQSLRERKRRNKVALQQLLEKYGLKEVSETIKRLEATPNSSRVG